MFFLWNKRELSPNLEVFFFIKKKTLIGQIYLNKRMVP